MLMAEDVYMPTITITVPENRLVQLKAMATRLGVTPEDLARLSIEELLSRTEDTMQQAITFVLTKNAELYRRLA
jgi:antitoxin FitA